MRLLESKLCKVKNQDSDFLRMYAIFESRVQQIVQVMVRNQLLSQSVGQEGLIWSFALEFVPVSGCSPATQSVTNDLPPSSGPPL